MSLSLYLCIYSMYICIYEPNPSPFSPFQSHPIHWIRFYSNLSLSFRVEISSPVDSVDSVDNLFTFAREQRWFFESSMNLLRPAPMILARGHRGRCKAPEPESRRVDLTNKIGWFFQQKYWYNGDLRSKIMQRDIE